MRRFLAALPAVALLATVLVSNVHAIDPSPSPCTTVASDARQSAPSDPVTTASGARQSPSPTASLSAQTCPAPDPTQLLYDKLTTELGGDLAKALTTQQQLSAALDQAAAAEQVLTDQISQEEDLVATLEDKLAALDTQISDTQSRIDDERAQVGAMARAMYRQPNNLFLVIARAGSISDALRQTADLVIAGQRAHALQSRLEADLAKLQAERDARQADLDAQNAAVDNLNNSFTSLDDLMNQQTDLSNQLDDLTSQIQDAMSTLTDQPPDVGASLAQLLEQTEQDLIAQAYQLAADQASLGSGLVAALHELPAGAGPGGLHLMWPLPGARVTQPFGPTNVVLEPPLGQYAHFHTGVDLAAPLGSPVLAAADGVVVAVTHSKVGYGNYVILAHGGGIVTLYAHLLETDVNMGDRVARGNRLGLEGSTGLSTGPHLHFELRIANQITDPFRYMAAPVAN
jgi:murein DD-endopeptidase MepM/ murein hydrolase activator NlpD